MARQDNFFALLGDGDDDDVSTLVERVAAMKVEPPAEEKKKKEKQQQRQQKQPEEKEESEWGPEDTGSMKAKPLVLPDHGDSSESMINVLSCFLFFVFLSFLLLFGSSCRFGLLGI